MPTRETAWPAGTPCWIDYGAADIEAAKAFYTDLLGWSYSGVDPQYGGYLTCESDGRPAAGMAPQMDPDDPPRWTTYLATSDADASAERVTDAGGTVVVAPMDVGPMGRMAIATDPQGHVFGLWQAGEHTGARVYNEPGSVVWNDAAVDDPAAARTFYSAVFDWRFEEMPGMDGYATFAVGDDVVGGLGGHRSGTPPGWTTCFMVASTDAAVEATTRGGGTVTAPAQDTEFGRFAVLADAWGAPFSVMQGAAG